MQSRAIVERCRAKPWAVDAAFTDERGLFEFAGSCESPVELYIRGLPSKLGVVMLKNEPDVPVIGTMMVRCRKCPECLTHRSRLWAARGCAETQLAPGRTWFGTLTLRPQDQFMVLARARVAARQRAVDWDELSEDERFQRVHAQIVREIQLWLKRLRGKASIPIRYLVVCEQHKSGLPHYHCLIHEHGDAISNRRLTAAWRLGFTKFKLVPKDEPEAVFYVTKYLAKSAVARILASARYGTASIGPRTATEQVEPVSEPSSEETTNAGANDAAREPSTCASEASLPACEELSVKHFSLDNPQS